MPEKNIVDLIQIAGNAGLATVFMFLFWRFITTTLAAEQRERTRQHRQNMRANERIIGRLDAVIAVVCPSKVREILIEDRVSEAEDNEADEQ